MSTQLVASYLHTASSTTTVQHTAQGWEENQEKKTFSKLQANKDCTHESYAVNNYCFAESSVKTKQEARWAKIVSTTRGQLEDD